MRANPKLAETLTVGDSPLLAAGSFNFNTRHRFHPQVDYNARESFMDGSTIAAVATPVGQGGIGIIRMSGVNAAAIAGFLFRKAERRRVQESAAGLRDARQGLSSHM